MSKKTPQKEKGPQVDIFSRVGGGGGRQVATLAPLWATMAVDTHPFLSRWHSRRGRETSKVWSYLCISTVIRDHSEIVDHTPPAVLIRGDSSRNIESRD